MKTAKEGERAYADETAKRGPGNDGRQRENGNRMSIVMQAKRGAVLNGSKRGIGLGGLSLSWFFFSPITIHQWPFMVLRVAPIQNSDLKDT